MQIDCSDALTWLQALPDQYAQCCVTSPPYYALRDYGTATWDGGSPDCEHVEQVVLQGALTEAQEAYDGKPRDPANNHRTNGTDKRYYKDVCGKCGAKRVDKQLGLEQTPQDYLDNMLSIFKELKRVLRDDGTLWLNMGDSYYGGGGYSPNSPANQAGSKQSTNQGSIPGHRKNCWNLQAKCLMGMPWRLALALVDDGWILRSDVIWHKPSVMPESCRDRPTKSHEYLFLLTKKPKYYYDAEAVREPTAASTPAKMMRGVGGAPGLNRPRQNQNPKSNKRGPNSHPKMDTENARRYTNLEIAKHAHELGKELTKEERLETGSRSDWDNGSVMRRQRKGPPGQDNPATCGHKDWDAFRPPNAKLYTHESNNPHTERGTLERSPTWTPAKRYYHPNGRNRRTVWTIATQPWKGEHFATFPQKLVEPCILAGCPEGGMVIDPFMGSGTTALVAKNLGRDAHGCDLNPEYCEMARKRVGIAQASAP